MLNKGNTEIVWQLFKVVIQETRNMSHFITEMKMKFLSDL